MDWFLYDGDLRHERVREFSWSSFDGFLVIKNKNEALNLTFSLNSSRINIFLDLIYIKMGKTSDETVIQMTNWT